MPATVVTMAPVQPAAVAADLQQAEVSLQWVPGHGGGLSCWVVRPAGPLRRLDPLVAVHGMQRGSREIAELLGRRAAAQGRVLIAPHFDEEGWRGYQRVVQSARADLALLALMQALRAQGLWHTDRFELFGYSGGAQFCHRFAWLHPRWVSRLSIAAAGWYTGLDALAYPYGIGPGGGRGWGRRLAAGLDRFLRIPMRVCVGEHDDVADDQTRRDPRIDGRQGGDRLSRARHWVQSMRAEAARRGFVADIDLSVLPGCGHDFVECAQRGGLLEHVLPDVRTAVQEATVPAPIGIGIGTPGSLAAQAKWAFTTRRVRRDEAVNLLPDPDAARPGDLVLCRVAQIGSHKKLQLAHGRASLLYPGDLVVLACGARYAPDQFEGVARLDREGADLLASGGVVGRMRHRHAAVARPTGLLPLGLLGDAQGQPLNLARYALPSIGLPAALPMIGVVGASMNAGKTTAMAALVHGLTRAGWRVAALKATGTGAFGDVQAYEDAGAAFVGDFTDAGMVSTYREPLSRIETGLATLRGHAAAQGCDIAVVEFADGVYQPETAALLADARLRALFHGFVYAAADALAMAGGCAVLRGMGITPLATTGLVTRSPLACQEARAATGLSPWRLDALCDPAQVGALLEGLVPAPSARGMPGAVARPGAPLRAAA